MEEVGGVFRDVTDEGGRSLRDNLDSFTVPFVFWLRDKFDFVVLHYGVVVGDVAKVGSCNVGFKSS